ncbi:hypothetical protein J2W44_006211 [Priestia aryabhattai]|uniref:hypothetical protein n=1 Tax=Priestia aryabhattai TaxID=412384 RepID=UPI0027E579B7|nr:hypothetical protein [Priestia aryabhattai]MDP9727051.1 hypothetical protein [Priestia aryabhattai]
MKKWILGVAGGTIGVVISLVMGRIIGMLLLEIGHILFPNTISALAYYIATHLFESTVLIFLGIIILINVSLLTIKLVKILKHSKWFNTK